MCSNIRTPQKHLVHPLFVNGVFNTFFPNSRLKSIAWFVNAFAPLNPTRFRYWCATKQDSHLICYASTGSMKSFKLFVTSMRFIGSIPEGIKRDESSCIVTYDSFCFVTYDHPFSSLHGVFLLHWDPFQQLDLYANSFVSKLLVSILYVHAVVHL